MWRAPNDIHLSIFFNSIEPIILLAVMKAFLLKLCIKVSLVVRVQMYQMNANNNKYAIGAFHRSRSHIAQAWCGGGRCLSSTPPAIELVRLFRPEKHLQEHRSLNFSLITPPVPFPQKKKPFAHQNKRHRCVWAQG